MTIDQDCVVSVLNRTVRAESNGTFSLPNVPSSMGRIRARATCVRDGETLSGETDYFEVDAGGSDEVGIFFLDSPEPVPDRLIIENGGLIQFYSIGSGQNLQVSAIYPSGQSLTNPEGLNFSVSNPATVEIDSAGRITAKAAGSAVITARKDGVVALASVLVSTTGDTDGDGIADDIEVSLGLNPNDPIDGKEDWDSDGLANHLEVTYGTGMEVADTDGDGVEDGEEVFPGQDGFTSDPLKTDTDNDGIPDGLELLAGTDPSDAADGDVSSLIVNFNVSPDSIAYTVNTVDGEQFVSLSVTAELIDGTVLDVTSQSSYGIDDLLVCTPGGAGEPGFIYLSGSGDCAVTVNYASQEQVVPITVDRFDPVDLGVLAIGSSTHNVTVGPNGRYVYVAHSGGMSVVDARQPENSRVVGTLSTASANDIRVSGNTAYLASGTAGVVAVDITDPTAPIEISRYDTIGEAADLQLESSNLLYVADGTGGVLILDVADPAAMIERGWIVTSASARGIAVDEEQGIAAIAMGTDGLELADISEPTAASVISSLSGGDVRDVEFHEGAVILADFSRSLVTVDVSNPNAPVLGAAMATAEGGRLNDVAIAGDLSFGADTQFVNGVPVAYLQPPAVPLLRAFIDFSSYDDANGTGIAVTNDLVFLTGDSNLYIGQYRKCEDVDADELCDAREAAWGTTVGNDDSDGDGVKDGVELRWGMDPSDPNDGGQAVFDGVSVEIPSGQTLESVIVDGSALTGSDLRVRGDFSLVGANSSITLDSLVVEGDLSLDLTTVTLEVNQLEVLGDVNVTNGAVLTTQYANSSSKTLYPLTLDVVGTVTVDSTSSIDLSGRGYPGSYWSGPDFSNNTRRACHGGIVYGNSADCTYGRYFEAEFPGSAGYYRNSSEPGRGGGLIGITASALVLDGTIKAQGQKTYHDDLPAGAGGSIHVDVGMLTGAGTFSVEGGRNTYNFRDTAPAGAGGRISVFADDVAGFTGVYRTASGVSSRNTVSGAGTTYVKLSTEDYGHLLSENGGRVAG
ncbi:LVIVD repeat-containing protein, partial [Halioglobus sp. HI00S01]|uniref:LVIVD repeat-containing protein n=1 Tax=Halioglobus sp. HI00S01 TaxID=1822214 RepID=UPI0018D496A4